MLNLTYHWLHIPTGTQGTRSQRFHSHWHFLEELNHWNNIGPNWKYWA